MPHEQMTFGELGVATSRHVSAGLYEDWLPQLRGPKAVKVWQEMSDNDPTIGSLLFAIEMLFRSVDWTAEPASETPADVDNAIWLETVIHGMRRSWADIIADVTTMLPFGWYAAEQIFTERDGRLVWADLAYRPQPSVLEWVTDENGQPAGMVQDDGRGGRIPIPVEKLLLFRTVNRGAPTGRSILRNAYRPWKMKNRSEDWAVIGAERALGGIPEYRIPSDMILEGGTTYESAKQLVTRVKRDEQAGIVTPSDRDEHGNALYEFSLIKGEGTEGLRFVTELIRMFANDILATVLAGFIALGRDAVGSRALAEPQQELFQSALEGWLDAIAGVFNRHGIPQLFALNGITTGVPSLSHSPVKDTALDELGNFILRTAQAGADWDFTDDTISNRVRQLAGFPAETAQE